MYRAKRDYLGFKSGISKYDFQISGTNILTILLYRCILNIFVSLYSTKGTGKTMFAKHNISDACLMVPDAYKLKDVIAEKVQSLPDEVNQLHFTVADPGCCKGCLHIGQNFWHHIYKS